MKDSNPHPYKSHHDSDWSHNAGQQHDGVWSKYRIDIVGFWPTKLDVEGRMYAARHCVDESESFVFRGLRPKYKKVQQRLF
jgi:hypothetical protein